MIVEIMIVALGNDCIITSVSIQPIEAISGLQ